MASENNYVFSCKLLILMVARDGIEPPTPAFSGPRSTTELPGLSANCVAISCAGSGAWPAKVGTSANSVMQQLCQYINSQRVRQTAVIKFRETNFPA